MKPVPSLVDRLIQRYARAAEHPAKLRLFDWMYRLVKGRRPVEVIAAGGFRFRLYPADAVDRCILFDGWHERRTTGLLQQNLRPGEFVFIAGAHLGYHVLHAARAVGPTGRVIACEPEPSSLLRAWEHLRLNDLTANVTLLAQAVGEAPGYAVMAEPPAANSGAASLLAPAAGSPYRAQVDRIADVLARLGVPRLDVLLLDVEGGEPRALAGLGPHRPRLMILESDPRLLAAAGNSQDGFHAAIRDLGYTLHDVGGNPVTGPGYCSEANVVAVRQGEPPPRWAP